MSQESNFHSAVPVLPSLNVRAAAEFYQHKLGFTCVATFDNGPQDQYAILKRGAAEIHLWGCADRYLVENSGCFVRVNQIEAVYAELRERGVVVAAELERQEPGGQQFSVYDADGNLLRFGEANGA
jgi:catechol 2,3-dioxygenase-like lactoylglutathione lyase family enzyme